MLPNFYQWFLQTTSAPGLASKLLWGKFSCPDIPSTVVHCRTLGGNLQQGDLLNCSLVYKCQRNCLPQSRNTKSGTSICSRGREYIIGMWTLWSTGNQRTSGMRKHGCLNSIDSIAYVKILSLRTSTEVFCCFLGCKLLLSYIRLLCLKAGNPWMTCGCQLELNDD